MKITLNRLVVTAAIAGFSIAGLSHFSPAAATSIGVSAARPAIVQSDVSPSKGRPSCSAILSVEELTPLQVYVNSGQFVLASQPTATQAQCVHLALAQYHYQYSQRGWDPTTTCTRAVSQIDTILVYMTYTWNGGPSTRVNGYATICNALIPVPNVNPL